MFGTYLKNKFGKKKEIPAADKFYSPLRIGLHSTIEIKTVDWIVIKEQLNKTMVLPSSNMSVVAIGEMKADDDLIYHIYMVDQSDQEFILQLYCTNIKVNEATLFKQVVNIIPLTESEWDEHMGSIGDKNIELDGNTYDRVWGSEHNGHIDLIKFNETIVEQNKTTDYVDNYLLYGRTFKNLTGVDEKELLLVGVEETDETAEITMMLGLSIPLHNINIQ